jgi:DNA-directed RNA polymerase specialized sigma24 family protein
MARPDIAASERMRAPSNPTEADRQAYELLTDPEFLRVAGLVTAWMCRRYRMTEDQAREGLLSAIGEPKVIASIQAAIHHARETGEHTHYPHVIVRRRVLDLLRSQSPRKPELSLAALGPAGGVDLAADAQGEPPESAEVGLLRQERSRQVLRIMDEFAGISPTHVYMLRRRLLEDASYDSLSSELGCSPGAARVRVHNAKIAFRDYVERSYPTLRSLWLSLEELP